MSVIPVQGWEGMEAETVKSSELQFSERRCLKE